ncbi:MAG: hypothetical protein KGO02_23645 [Alphaproteobacteria bacterium]|nr:hypothetical protein [Alphaproteobacteria bacterium]
MINALSPAWIVRSISFLVMLAAWASLLRVSPTEAFHLWAQRGTVIGIVNAVIFALTFRPIFLGLYRVTLAKYWWFPLLEGRWEGELHSNWPRIRAMMLAAKGAAPAFDALTDELPSGSEQITRLEATIKCSMFSIELEIRIPGTERASRTVFVRPQWRRPEPPQITYVYDQIDHGQVAVTDAPRHRGAAVLTYDASTGELRGEYWTNRQGAKGLNTAGSLILRRA